jgi:hypothetical protein
MVVVLLWLRWRLSDGSVAVEQPRDHAPPEGAVCQSTLSRDAAQNSGAIDIHQTGSEQAAMVRDDTSAEKERDGADDIDLS